MSRTTRRVLRLAAISAVPLLPLGTAQVSNALTYDQTNGSDVWDLTTNNWDGSTVPWVNGGAATFTGAGEALSINAGISASTIVFSAATSGFVLNNGGGSLTLTGATGVIANQTSGANTITSDLVLAQAANSSVNITVNGATGITVLSGDISEVNAGVRLSMSRVAGAGGTLILAGNNSFTGGITATQSGTAVHLNHNNAMGTGALQVPIALSIDNSSGGAVNLPGNAISLSGGNLAYLGSTGQNLSFGNNVVSIIGGGRSFDVNGGTVTVGSLIDDGGARSFSKGGLGTLVITGNGTYGGTTGLGGGTLILEGTLATTGLTLTTSNANAVLRNPNALANASILHRTGTVSLRSDTDNTLFTTADYIIDGLATAFISVDRLNTGSNLMLRLGNITATAAGTQTLAVNAANGYGLSVGVISQTSTTASTLTLDNNGNNMIVGGFTSASNNTPKIAFTDNGHYTVTGNIMQTGSAAVAVDKSGSGTLVLQGSGSNFSGVFAQTNGTVQTSVASAFGNTSQININNVSTLALRADSNTTFGNPTAYNVGLTSSGATINVDRATNAGGGATITLGNLSLPGAYAVNLTGANGTSLQLGAVSGSTATNKTITNNIAGGGGLTIASYAETNASAQTITFGGSGTTTVTGNITQNAGNALTVAYTGSGRLILNGANGHTGNTTVSGGIMQLNSAAAIGGSGRTLGIGTAGTASPAYAIDQAFLDRVILVSAGTVALGADSANNLTFVSGPSSVILSATGNYTYSGTLTPALSNSTYRFGGAGGGNLTVSSVISGATNTFTFTGGGGRTILTADNTVGGAAGFANGSIVRGVDATEYASNATLNDFFGTGTLSISTGAAVAIEFRANGRDDQTGQVLTVANAWLGSTGNQNLTIDVDRASAGTNDRRNKTIAIQALNFAANATTQINVTGGNGYSLRAASVILGGAAANTQITLNPTTANFIVGTGAAAVTNSNSGTGIKNLILSGTSTGNVIDGTIGDGAAGQFTTAVTKNGTSTWTITGAGNFSSGTTVTAGRLMVDGVGSGSTTSGLGTGAVQVTGGTLGGTGRILGTTNVAAGATLLAGDGVTSSGDLELAGDLTMADASIISMVLGNGGAHSTLTRTGVGTWTFDSDQAFNFLADGLVTVNDTFDNIVTGVDMGASPINLAWTTTGNSAATGNFVYDGAGGIDFTFSAVPEPATLSLLALTGVGLLSRRRRKP